MTHLCALVNQRKCLPNEHLNIYRVSWNSDWLLALLAVIAALVAVNAASNDATVEEIKEALEDQYKRGNGK